MSTRAARSKLRTTSSLSFFLLPLILGAAAGAVLG